MITKSTFKTLPIAQVSTLLHDHLRRGPLLLWSSHAWHHFLASNALLGYIQGSGHLLEE